MMVTLVNESTLPISLHLRIVLCLWQREVRDVAGKARQNAVAL